MFKTNKNLKNTIYSFAGALVLAAVTNGNAYANSCERTYGGGLECDKSINIIKEVRKEGDTEWKETVKNVKKGDIVEFRIRVKNTGDVDMEDLNVIDELPEELDLVGGDLTHTITLIDNGDTKEYILKVKVNNDEYEAGVNKCVVNLVRLKGDLNDDGNRETIDTDTATVCYGQGVTELPKTGAEDTLAYSLAGLGMILVGLGIKRFQA